MIYNHIIIKIHKSYNYETSSTHNVRYNECTRYPQHIIWDSTNAWDIFLMWYIFNVK